MNSQRTIFTTLKSFFVALTLVSSIFFPDVRAFAQIVAIAPANPVSLAPVPEAAVSYIDTLTRRLYVKFLDINQRAVLV